MTLKLEYDETLRLLKRAVMEKGGDYVYKTDDADSIDNYFYFNPANGAPGCIVGHVLHYRGLTLEDLPGVNVGCGVQVLRDKKVIDVQDDTFALLEYAQTDQDQGTCWGSAVESAESAVDSMSRQDVLVG